MNRFVIAALIVLSVIPEGLAQARKNGLFLTGSVQSIRSECINGERVAAVGVYFQFRNDSGSAVVLYPPSMLFDASVKYSDSTSAVDTFRHNPYLDNPWGSPTRDDYDPRLSLTRKMDVDHPSQAGLVTIEPGGYYEFRDMLWPKAGFKIVFTPRKISRRQSGLNLDHLIKACGEGRTVVTPKHRAFRVKYDLNQRKQTGATDLLKSLQGRWKPFGDFILDRNDDISYETEEITLMTK